VTRIACEEKGIDYELAPVMPHGPEVLGIHPLGKIPAMRHGDVLLGESRAICLYIDQAFAGPSLIPENVAAAARVEQWISIVMTHIDPLLIRRYAALYYFPKTPDGRPDRELIHAAIPEMRIQISMLERAVANGFLAGDCFSLADAYLVPVLFYMNLLPESRAMLVDSPRLLAYLERHLQRRSVAATTAPPFPGRELRIAS
ncbi:MAG: glutathione S-transferase family protein, partial [Povalibacter sp.]